MTSPTKLNSGTPNSRPVTTNNVINAENRDVEREQLNRILSSFADRINSVESSSGGSGGSSAVAVTNNDGTITVVSNGNTFVIGIADNGVNTTQLANDSVTTAKLATVNSNVGSFGTATQTSTFTVNAKGQVTAASNTTIAIPSTQVTDFTEAAQDAVGGMVNATLTYNDATPSLGINLNNANSWTAAQTFSSVDINGGTIDGTSIGATTPSTGALTTLSTTDNITVGTAAGATTRQITIRSASGQTRRMLIQSGTSARWVLAVTNEAESGANAGSNLWLERYADDGSFLGFPVQITRSSGAISLGGNTSITGTFSTTQGATLGDSTSDSHTVNGSLTGTTNIQAATYFAVDTVFTTDANTGTETANVDLANGSVQKFTRNGSYTLNITGPSSKHLPSCTIYVYLNTTGAAVTTLGSPFRFLTTGGSIIAGVARTLVINGFWDGTYFFINGYSELSGDLRPS